MDCERCEIRNCNSCQDDPTRERIEVESSGREVSHCIFDGHTENFSFTFIGSDGNLIDKRIILVDEKIDYFQRVCRPPMKFEPSYSSCIFIPIIKEIYEFKQFCTNVVWDFMISWSDVKKLLISKLFYSVVRELERKQEVFPVKIKNRGTRKAVDGGYEITLVAEIGVLKR